MYIICIKGFKKSKRVSLLQVFPDNCLRITHSAKGSGIEFKALDALKLVNDKEDVVKVAIAEAWKEARYNSPI